MGKYEYFRKIRTNGNLLIFCQTTTTYFGAKMDKRGGQNLEYLLSKSIFQLTRYLNNFSVVSNQNVSNAYHFQLVGAFK